MNEIEVTVRGWVGQRPKLVDTKGQASMLAMRVGTTPRRKDRTGAWTDGETRWFSVIAFGDLAENASRSLRKGDPVLVRGRLELRRSEREGREYCSHEIVADAIGPELTFGTALYAPTVRREREEAALSDHGDAEEGERVPEMDLESDHLAATA
jgi:single-strand DNA-binding protein